jgi:hypothetical protein
VYGLLELGRQFLFSYLLNWLIDRKIMMPFVYDFYIIAHLCMICIAICV